MPIAHFISRGFWALTFIAGFHATALASGSAVEIIDKSRAVYAALTSYADTGTVTTENAPPGATARTPVMRERHAFSTFYRSPRSFLFSFRKVSGEQFVVWSDGGDFQTWWSATHVHQQYPKGKGSTAFALASFPTSAAVMQISPLLFSTAGLQGPLVALNEPRLEGTEDLNKHRTYRIVATVGLAYGKTGAVTNTRTTTVWIDADTYLVRRVVEDTPSNAPTGLLDRITTTFEPQPNAKIEDKTFRFQVP